jgi:hypothetical protein
MPTNLDDELKRLQKELETFVVQDCEIYSRVVGYYRPLKQYNIGKQVEFSMRVNFDPILN